MAARIAEWVFCALLAVIGAWLAIQGVQLIGLGGSWYYVLAGAAAVGVAVLTFLRNVWGPRLYAILLLLTTIWSIYEAGVDLLALLPRLAAWLAFGLWFLTPWHGAYMRGDDETRARGEYRFTGAAILLGLVVLLAGALQGYKVEKSDAFAAAAPTTTSETASDWPNYGNSPKGTRFAELTQINTETVRGLKEVWRYRTGVPYDFKNTPLKVGDTVYVCTAGDIVIALDASTGAENWKFDSRTKVPGARDGDISGASTFARTCRSVGYYEAPAQSAATAPATPAPATPATPAPAVPAVAADCPKRILIGTVDGRLLAIDALTGIACRTFGSEGEVNIQSGLGRSPPGNYMNTSGPLIAGNVAVVGGWVTDNQELGNPSGVIRAYDVMTGEFRWAWDMGKPNYHGLPDEGGEYTRGTPNVWSLMSYDPELNLIYAPTGNPSPDYFGGKRREYDDKYSSSTVAIDASTGEMRWSYQNTHHDIWDYDNPSQPVLVDITKDGKRIPAVAQPTKRAEIFLLDRRDGTPIWPATTCGDGSKATPEGECPVPQGPVEGDYVTKTQPMSGLPNFRPDRFEKDMWGLTPLDQLHCRIEYKKMRYEGHFTPPMGGGGGDDSGKATFGGSFQFPGNAGGFNWPSVSVDADRGLLVAQPMLMGNRIVMVSEDERKAMFAARPRPPGPPTPAARPAAAQPRPEPAPYTAQGEWDPKTQRYGLTSPFMSTWAIPFTKIATNVPCFEPPYGLLAVIDLNTNKLLWKRAIGTAEEMGPFGIGLGLPFQVGTPIYGGVLTTRAGLIFQVGSMDSTLRAIDIKNGQIVWQTKLPGTANSTPITYISEKDGKQYIVVCVPNPGFVYPRDGDSKPSDDQGGYVIAFALDAPPK